MTDNGFEFSPKHLQETTYWTPMVVRCLFSCGSLLWHYAVSAVHLLAEAVIDGVKGPYVE